MPAFVAYWMVVTCTGGAAGPGPGCAQPQGTRRTGGPGGAAGAILPCKGKGPAAVDAAPGHAPERERHRMKGSAAGSPAPGRGGYRGRGRRWEACGGWEPGGAPGWGACARFVDELVEDGWRAFVREEFGTLPEEDERRVAEMVIDEPARDPWRVVDAAYDRLRC